MKCFLHGPALTDAIKEILAEDGSRSAVAFWGRDCEGWVTGVGAKIIANLRMGGTNPHALKKVAAQTKRCDRLHAKVYIGSTRAVVASANASINGLALEGAEIASWIEAGIVTDEIVQIGEWFDDLWLSHSHEITKGDWDRAEAAWKLRPRAKPTLSSFADFDPLAAELPLTTWLNEGTWTVHEDELEAQLGVADSRARTRVDEGIGVSHTADESVVANRWVLCWLPGARPRTSKSTPWFLQTSDVIIRGGFTFDETGVLSDVMLAPDERSPQPFDPGEKRFVTAFKRVLGYPDYVSLHDDEVPGRPWFAEREPMMRAFWRDVKETYDLLDLKA